MDELDALLAHYEQQAAADVAAVQQRAQPAAKRQRMTAADKREEALAQPLGADNKCVFFWGGCVCGCIRLLQAPRWSLQVKARCATGGGCMQTAGVVRPCPRAP